LGKMQASGWKIFICFSFSQPHLATY
jgi:hypothetical protein